MSEPEPLQQLVEVGQSPWLDFLSRDLIDSGRMVALVRDGSITGLTSNPTIFRKAITDGEDYHPQIESIAQRGASGPYEAFFEMAAEDVARAADVLMPVHVESGSSDGFVSLELPPTLAEDTDGSIAEVERLTDLVNRRNVMIKVPGTEAGVSALRVLTARGYNVNVTLLFSVERYSRIANAYIEGLEQRIAMGGSPNEAHSVASFFVSRVDRAVDRQLPEDSPLRGKAAIANALNAYRTYESIFSGERWERLAERGALPQRLLWGSTSAKDPSYSDVKYVEGLILPETVNTMPEDTLEAFADHGRVEPATSSDFEVAATVLEDLAAEDIDLEDVSRRLLDEGLQAFAEDFTALLTDIEHKLSAARAA